MNSRLERLFTLALEQPTEEREEFVERECAGDSELLAQVRRLLESDRAAGSATFWKLSAAQVEGLAVQEQADPRLGQMFGPYRVTGVIGAGGMGTVYSAARDDAEYRQRVALKLVKFGLDTGSMVQRFRHERQIQANLEHPNIARLLDGGTADGVPYLVMEFVEGVPLHRYCAENRLSVAERLRLFRQVCSAVQFAHQRLVIHRDLKPGNILVTADGTPKLLDFGIAKLLSGDGEDGADTRTLGEHLLTPGYASPEQVKGEPITTASDVYSLGVILYELLTGRSPYTPPSGAALELIRAVCEEEPRRPSTASQEPQVVSPVAREKLRGDLDNIVLMALRKDPLRRYSSVEQLSEDLRRHLAGLPVAARGDGYWYVVGKFVQRHRLGVAAAGLALAALSGGVVAIHWEQAKAERRFNEVRKLAHAVLFDYHDAIEDLPGSTPVRRKLVQDALGYLGTLAKEADDPSLQRELVEAYVKVSHVQGNEYYSNLGDTQGAFTSARQAVSLGERLVAQDGGPLSRRVLGLAYGNEAELLHQINNVSEALGRYRQSAVIQEELERGGHAEWDDRVVLAATLRHLGDVLGADGISNLGKSAEALTAYRRSLAVAQGLVKQRPGTRAAEKEVYETLIALAAMERTAGHRAAAEEGGRQALGRIQAISAADPNNTMDRLELAGASLRLGRQLADDGKPAEGLPYLRTTVEIMEKLAAEDPNNVLYQRNLSVTETHVGNALRHAGDAAGALRHQLRALQLAERLSGADPANTELLSDVANSHRKLGEALMDLRRFGDARAHFLKSVALYRAMTRNSEDANLLSGLARAATAAGDAEMSLRRPGAALESYREGVAMGLRLVQHDAAQATVRQDLAEAQMHMAKCQEQLGDCGGARASFGAAGDNWKLLRQQQALGPGDSLKLETTAVGLAACLR